MSEPYKYTVEDRSVLLPYYKKYLWEPALARIPSTTSPNTLSILANLGSLLSFVVLLAVSPDEPWWFLVPAVGTFAYLCLDNMDGTHARRTQQTSPLGEFIDHWFDSFNTGFLTLGAGASVEPEVDLSGWWIDGDRVHIGAIDVGAGAVVGARSTLMPGARVGARAEVAPGSAVQGAVKAGQLVPWYIRGGQSYTQNTQDIQALTQAIVNAKDVA